MSRHLLRTGSALGALLALASCLNHNNGSAGDVDLDKSGQLDVEAIVAQAGEAFTQPPDGATTPKCQAFLAQLADKGIEHGIATVPLFHELPDGPKVDVHYYGEWQGRDATPIIFWPGFTGAAWSKKSYKIFFFEALRDQLAAAQIPWVAIDQRGTGCSVQYPAQVATSKYEAQAYYGFTSPQLVRDGEAIRRELFGERPWVVAGQSYGSIVVHQYLATFPQHVRAAFAHGFGLAQDRSAMRGLYQQWMMDLFTNFWQAHPALHAKRDQVFAKYLAEVQARCPDEPGACPLGLYPDELADVKLLDSPAGVTAVTAWLDAVIDGAQAAWRSWQPYPADYAGTTDAFSAATSIVARMDYLPAPLRNPADEYDCGYWQAKHFASKPLTELAGMKVTNWSAQCNTLDEAMIQLYTWTKNISVGPSLPAVAQALRSHADSGLWLYSGRYDDIAPTKFFEGEAQTLGAHANFTMVYQANADHGGYANPDFYEEVIAQATR